MANVKIMGNAIYLTSALKLGDIKKLEKYNPEALLLKGGKDDEELLFRVCTRKGGGSIDRNGAIFDAEKEADKPASLTMVYAGGSDITEYVKDTLGLALVRLNKLEASIPAALEAVDADRAALDAMIEVLG